MDWEVTCECGWTFRGSQDELANAVISHGRDVHGIEVTREQALGQARPTG